MNFNNSNSKYLLSTHYILDTAKHFTCIIPFRFHNPGKYMFFLSPLYDEERDYEERLSNSLPKVTQEGAGIEIWPLFFLTSEPKPKSQCNTTLKTNTAYQFCALKNQKCQYVMENWRQHPGIT